MHNGRLSKEPPALAMDQKRSVALATTLNGSTHA